MAAHDLEAFTGEERNPLQQLGADERVPLHHPLLVGAQRARLVEDRVGDPDLAEVVEEEAVLEARVVEQARLDGLG